jgi:glycosyltransferase involved in cell wall biosynthesis
MKTAAIFNPYWDTLGGGEKYVAVVVEAYLRAGYQPHILWHDPKILHHIRIRFGLPLKGAVVDTEFYSLFKSSSPTTKLKLSSQFDSFFWLSDGSIPLLGSKQNILHFQVPFNKKASLINRVKIKNFDLIICNSVFTKKIIDNSYSCKSKVLYPPITLMPQAKKENIILSVGRFDNILHSKRQDILINAFKELNPPGWALILAGGSLNSSGKITSLKKFIGNHQITVIVNPSFNKIKQLYSTAKIYWHAAGYGANLKKNPERAEHFGIVTVEAMSAGVIPVVFAGGGQLEIIQDGYNGYLWQTPDELISRTQTLIEDNKTNQNIIDHALETAKTFKQERFIHEFRQYLS